MERIENEKRYSNSEKNYNNYKKHKKSYDEKKETESIVETAKEEVSAVEEAVNLFNLKEEAVEVNKPENSTINGYWISIEGAFSRYGAYNDDNDITDNMYFACAL